MYKLGVTIGFGSSSLINGSDETLGGESLPLGHVRLIEDGALRFCHVAWEEEALRDLVRLIVNRPFRFLDGSSNPSRYNSLDEWPGFIYLIKWIVDHWDAAMYPPHLSENEGLRLSDLYSYWSKARERATSPAQLNKQKKTHMEKIMQKSWI